MQTVDLSNYKNPEWRTRNRGSLVRRGAWHVINAMVLQNPLVVSSTIKVAMLRLFGAKIGTGVLLKPGISIKFPWELEVGNHSWIGEATSIDNLARVTIGSSVCISPGSYIVSGSHDMSDPAFGPTEEPIVIEDGSWVGARAIVLPGARLSSHSVLAAGAVLSMKTEPFMFYAGNPARPVKKRIVGSQDSEKAVQPQGAAPA